MNPKLIGLIGGVALLGSSGAALAHHSAAMFDATREVTLEGTVKEFQWSNPHAWVQLNVTDAKSGKVVEWSLEAGSPNNLGRKGWKRTSLKPGDKAVIVIHPLKDGQAGGNLQKVTVNGQLVGQE